MSKTKAQPTAGDWYLEIANEDYDGHVIRTAAKAIATTCTMDAVNPTPEETANAELLASAPRLLREHRELRVMLGALVNLHEGIDSGGNGIEKSDWGQAKAILRRIKE